MEEIAADVPRVLFALQTAAPSRSFNRTLRNIETPPPTSLLASTTASTKSHGIGNAQVPTTPHAELVSSICLVHVLQQEAVRPRQTGEPCVVANYALLPPSDCGEPAYSSHHTAITGTPACCQTGYRMMWPVIWLRDVARGLQRHG